MLALALVLTGGCRTRTFHAGRAESGDAGTKAVKPAEIPNRFVVVSGQVSGLEKAAARLTGLLATIRFRAEASAKPGCAAGEWTPGEGTPKEEFPGWRLTPEGTLSFLARSRFEGERFEVHVPLRLGLLLDVCRFRPESGLELVFEALVPERGLVTFGSTVAVDALTEGLASRRGVLHAVAFPAQGPFLTASASALTASAASHAPSTAPSPLRDAQDKGTSYAEVRARLTSTRNTSDTLPSEPGLGTAAIGLGILGNALGIDLRDERVRADQTRTLVSKSDTREPTTKAFHPFGVCAFARWRTSAASTWSGVFAPGTDLPVVVRFSGAGNNTTTRADFGLVHRMLGLAVKIFPAPREDVATRTVNLLLFDDGGPWGNKSPWYLFNDPRKNTLFFTNWIYGFNVPTAGTLNSFGRLVFEPRHAPLTRLSLVKGNGDYEAPSRVSVPFLARVQYSGKKREEKHVDLRSELLTYEAGDLSFDVFLSPSGTAPEALKQAAAAGEGVRSGGSDAPAARLEDFSKPFVSEACEKDLHFAHSAH